MAKLSEYSDRIIREAAELIDINFAQGGETDMDISRIIETATLVTIANVEIQRHGDDLRLYDMDTKTEIIIGSGKISITSHSK